MAMANLMSPFIVHQPELGGINHQSTMLNLRLVGEFLRTFQLRQILMVMAKPILQFIALRQAFGISSTAVTEVSRF